MSVRKIFPLDPYNEDHLKIIKEIINNSKFEAYYCNTLLENRNSFTKEEYLESETGKFFLMQQKGGETHA